MEDNNLKYDTSLTEEDIMIPARRLEQIKSLINENGCVSISELTRRFQVSKATIRRDLNEICSTGEYIRTHGGAMAYTGNTMYDKPHEDKMMINYEQKMRIGKAASTYVQNGDTIIVDSGTTGYAFAQCLEEKKQITVITNDLYIALNTVLDASSSMIILPGQRLDLTRVIIGKQAEDLLKSIKVAKLFMTADAICLETGIANVNLLESGIKSAMIKAATEVILMADSSKFEKKSLINILPDFSRISRIITDDALPVSLQKKYRKRTELVIV